jgi:hypothetical protein
MAYLQHWQKVHPRRLQLDLDHQARKQSGEPPEQEKYLAECR